MKVSDEAVQRLVAKDIDRHAIILASRRPHIDDALVASHPGASLARADERLAKRAVAGLFRVIRENPGDRANYGAL